MKPNTQKQKLSTYERNKNMTQKKNERERVTLVRREGKRFRERNTRISYYYDYYVHYYKHVYVYDDDCFYYHSWRNNVVIAFGTLSSFLT